MKSTNVLTPLAMVLIAALLVFGPVTSRAADTAVDSHSEPRAQRTAEQCLLKQAATASECGTGATGQLPPTGSVIHARKGSPQESPEQNDAAGALLEGLIAHSSPPDQEGL